MQSSLYVVLLVPPAWAPKREPDRKRARMLRARFDRIFTKKTGYVMLDRLLTRLYACKAELLRVLDRPDSLFFLLPCTEAF